MAPKAQGSAVRAMKGEGMEWFLCLQDAGLLEVPGRARQGSSDKKLATIYHLHSTTYCTIRPLYTHCLPTIV